MKNFGIVPLVGNPATAQIIIPGVKNHSKPFGAEPVQLSLPFPKDDKKDLYCNGCELLSRVARPGFENSQSHNCRCKGVTSIVNGRIIKLKVYPGEKIQKPYWCPIIKDKIVNGQASSKPQLFLPAPNKSAMSDEQLAAWNKSKEENALREKWAAIPGITAWTDIKVGTHYHMPPMLKKGRMDLFVQTKYCDSLMAYKKGTNERVWLYRKDEDYKFLSEIKKK